MYSQTKTDLRKEDLVRAAYSSRGQGGSGVYKMFYPGINPGDAFQSLCATKTMAIYLHFLYLLNIFGILGTRGKLRDGFKNDLTKKH